jgi:YfiH family protein
MLHWDTPNGVPVLLWTRVPGVVAAFSGRRGGVSTGAGYASLNLGLRSGDDRGRVVRNRRLLCEALGVDPARTSSCHQQHTATVHRVEDAPARAFDDEAVTSPVGDALVTTAPGRGIVAFAADCVPVVLARTDGAAVAVCHAGWRGLLAGVVTATAGLLDGEVVAAVGPCAGPRRYEVGPEVSRPLADRFGADVIDGRLADLARCAAIDLRAAGVAAVDVAGICTIEDDERFFSHRRDGATCGRQAVIAYRGVAA